MTRPLTDLLDDIDDWLNDKGVDQVTWTYLNCARFAVQAAVNENPPQVESDDE